MMMNNKSLVFILFISIFSLSSFAQQKKNKEKSLYYPVVVQFHSVCCGVPTDKPLIQYITTFKKANKIQKINAIKISPMGREGEYYLAFSLKEMNRRQKFLFRNKLKTIVDKMKDKGNASVEENVNIFKSELPGNVKFSKVGW
jgi:hypothetical protein